MGGVSWDILGLLQFLHCIPTIEILEFSFHGAQSGTSDIVSPMPTQLFNVRQLSVAIHENTHSDLVEEFMGHLELPNVETMSVKIDFDDMDVVSPTARFESLFCREIIST